MPAPDVQLRTAIAVERAAAALERLADAADRVVGRGSGYPPLKVNVHGSADTARAREIGDALIAVQQQEEARRRA